VILQKPYEDIKSLELLKNGPIHKVKNCNI
jgi:hypothetical protein